MKLLIILFIQTVLAHSWYPYTCCGGGDCKPVPCDQIVEMNDGKWRYIPSGTLFDPWRVHPSQDKYCHVCINDSGKNGLCVFIQNGV